MSEPYRIVKNFFPLEKCDEIVNSVFQGHCLSWHLEGTSFGENGLGQLLPGQIRNHTFNWVKNEYREYAAEYVRNNIKPEVWEGLLDRELIGDSLNVTDQDILVMQYDKGHELGEHTDPIATNYLDSMPDRLAVAVILLNDRFTGGEFTVYGKDVEFKKGDVLLYGQGVPHGVRKILFGTRMSLIAAIYHKDVTNFSNVFERHLSGWQDEHI